MGNAAHDVVRLLFVSVIVPVYDHVARLHSCLRALLRQSYPSGSYEVIVVDNTSDGSIQKSLTSRGGLADLGTGCSPPLVCLHEPVPGSYAARNTGAAAARGEVFAFTDADCIPDAGWLESGIRAMQQHPHAAIVAGRIDLFYRDPDAPTPVELFERLVAFEPKESAEKNDFGSTANIFARVAAFREVGGFNAELKSQGDVDFGQRIKAKGYGVVYCDEAVIMHPARRTFSELVHRSRRLAGGTYGIHQIRNASAAGRAIAFFRSAAQDLVPPLRFAARVYGSPHVAGIGEKLQVVFVLILVRWVSIVEKIRLALGGNAVR